jgi:hypothetical protein
MGFSGMTTERTIHVIVWVLLAGLMLFPPRFIGDLNVQLFIVLVAVYGSIVAVLWSYELRQTVAIRVTVGVAAVVCVLAVVVHTASHFGVWCCCGNLDEMCDMVRRISVELTANNIPFWVGFGSLLGAVREPRERMQSVPWEHDYDLCIHERDWLAFQKIMANAGIPVNVAHRQVLLGTLATMGRSYIDIYVFTEKDG